MASPLVTVMFSATSVLGVGAGIAEVPGASDSSVPESTEAGGLPECVLTPPDSDDTTEPPAIDPTEPSPGEAFFDAFCRHAQAVAAIDQSLTGVPSLDSTEQFRVGMCDPEFVPPDAEQARISWIYYVQGTAQSDPDIAESWADAGVLSIYEPADDNSGGTTEAELDDDVLAELVEIDITFVDTFAEHRDEWCADLAEMNATESTVAGTTEP